MKELVIGDPAALKTDIGPLIDHDARARLEKHVERLRAEAKEIFTLPLPEELRHSRRREAASGNPVCSNIDHAFFSPQIWEIPNVAFLTDEVFGPILHVVRYKPEDLPKLVAAINATGFGLTGGVHSRIDAVAGEIAEELHVGNLYVNRSIIGAVVGTQPFGGEGISGTGPKAGGPHYLPRFALERTVSINTTAAGGNATLLAAAGAD
ncbi:MAG: aldehyde dehydrogenase family protein [Alphaproteobacteria bacterium]